MQDMIDSLEEWGSVILFVYSLGGGYVGLITAGVMSALGKMDLWLAVPIACVGNIVGSSLLAYLARYQKKDINTMLQKHRRKIALAQVWLKRYDAWLIVLSKYLYGVKTIVPLAIGFSRFNLSRFYFINALSCVLWAVIVGVVGYYASSGVIALLEKIDTHSYVLPFVLFGLMALLFLIISQVSKKVKKTL